MNEFKTVVAMLEYLSTAPGGRTYRWNTPTLSECRSHDKKHKKTDGIDVFTLKHLHEKPGGVAIDAFTARHLLKFRSYLSDKNQAVFDALPLEEMLYMLSSALDEGIVTFEVNRQGVASLISRYA